MMTFFALYISGWLERVVLAGAEKTQNVASDIPEKMRVALGKTHWEEN